MQTQNDEPYLVELTGEQIELVCRILTSMRYINPVDLLNSVAIMETFTAVLREQKVVDRDNNDLIEMFEESWNRLNDPKD